MGEAKRRAALRSAEADGLGARGLKAMSRERYNAFVGWTRSPLILSIGTELEFFASAGESVIGVLIHDLIDDDYSYVVLGRDEKSRFRCVDLNASIPSMDAARSELLNALAKLTQDGKEAFPQGDAADDRAGVDLFTPVTNEQKWHPSFKIMQSNDQWSPARGILAEMMHHFVDVDGNFVEQFQTTGFDARLWELYLYAYMVEEGLYVERPDSAPDFSVSDGGQRVFVEAVTVGPTGNVAPVHQALPMFRSDEEIAKLLEGKIPIKFASALHSKLTRRGKAPYWKLPHVEGHPLVFAIADFHENQSMTWTSSALIEYLYGAKSHFSYDADGQLIIGETKLESHEFEGKKIPSGFFLQPDSENISAVLFTSSGTISKFNRMGRLAGFGIEKMTLMRVGVCHDHDPNAALPKRFARQIEPGQCTETWAEGLSMFHNPNAAHPIDPGMFPSIAHHRLIDGQIRSLIPEFHPYSSLTINIKFTDEN